MMTPRCILEPGPWRPWPSPARHGPSCRRRRRSQGQGGRGGRQDRHGNGKVDNYKLCLSMDRVAARYLADAKKAGKDVKPTDTPACADPGPSSTRRRQQRPCCARGYRGRRAAPAPKK
jgi:hypothetical protein